MTDTCFMCPKPKVVIVYVFPHNGHEGWANKAVEFVASYHHHPPGMAHETVIVSNGAEITEPSMRLFESLPGLKFVNHDNSGWDIGAFQLCAKTIPCDLMVFFGSHTYFRRAGWLARMWSVYQEHGDTLYGATGAQGNIPGGVWPHVRTTAFWCHPQLFSEYPATVIEAAHGGQRYNFEHGPNCLTSWVMSLGRQPYVVGWDAIAPVWQCDTLPEGFHQGTQRNLLVGDRLCCEPYYPHA